jgi:hypothetical protein
MEKLLRAVLPVGCIAALIATLLLPWERAQEPASQPDGVRRAGDRAGER